MSDKKQANEDEVFEFLNSLPDQKEGGDMKSKQNNKEQKNGKSGGSGKTDQEILDFLDELEATNKNQKGDANVESIATKGAPKVTGHAKDEASPETEAPKEATQPEEVNDPITSLSKWWSGNGSKKVSSGITSLWGTAQTLTQQAQVKAEKAIKQAKEQGVEDKLRTAFKDFGITGVLEGDRNLTNKEREELLKLPDTKKAVESINKGINLFSHRFTEVLETLNSKDEIINIKLVHDLKNYPNLSGYVKHNFEDVMSEQVDGNIEVHVEQSGTVSDSQTDEYGKRDIGLFQGKLSDADRLVEANIESIITPTKDKAGETPKPKEKTTPSSRATDIYIGLLAVTTNRKTGAKAKDNSTNEKDATDELDDDSVITIDEFSGSSFCFTATLIDKTHDIKITNRSQPFPLKWSQWIDGDFSRKDKEEDVDPSEWVIDWIDQGLDKTFGVMAQTYVIMRMGY